MRKGFTLIELLVVFSIFAIWASIPLPSLGTAREKARQTSCSNNLHQIGVGFLMYSQDYDGYLPQPATYWNPHLQLYPGYVSNWRVFWCQSYKYANNPAAAYQ